MIRKKSQRTQAIELRKRGFTYREIAKIVDVSISTVSLWLSRETWSQNIRETNQKRAARENGKRISLLNKARSNQHKKLYAEAERSAITEYKHYKTNPLFIAGLTLYMAEGDHAHPHLIRVASTNMEIHRVIIAFAEQFLGVSREKVRFWLLLHPDQDPLACTQMWSTHTGLPSSRFHKPQVIQGKGTNRRLQYGVGNTIIGSAVLKKKLLKWTELILQDLR